MGGIPVKKRKTAAVLLAMAVLLPGCGNPEKDLYHILEKTAAAEKEFESRQKPMTELEEKENGIFGEIMKLGMKEMDKVESLSDEALKNLEERHSYLKKEEEAMAASKKEFGKIHKLIPDLKDKKLQEHAKQLETLMSRRYDAHALLVSAYEEAIREDEKIYGMLKNEDLKLEDLERQIEASNKAKENVIEANRQFNEFTEKFNKEKAVFYKKAGLQTEN
jgi:hypothetical protein